MCVGWGDGVLLDRGPGVGRVVAGGVVTFSCGNPLCGLLFP